MTARFELKIYNNVELKTKATLCGTLGRDIIHLVLENDETKSNLSIEFSAAELVLAASRLSAGPDGTLKFPEIVWTLPPLTSSTSFLPS